MNNPLSIETDENGNLCLRPGYNLTEADWAEIWKGRDAKTAAEEKINISELCVRYSEDGKRWYLVRTTNAVESLATTLRPTIQRGDEILAQESTETPYRYMECAWGILIRGRRAKWKTVGVLRTLRQAIREVNAQGMDVDIPEPGASRAVINKFLTVARVFDAIHHGRETF